MEGGRTRLKKHLYIKQLLSKSPHTEIKRTVKKYVLLRTLLVTWSLLKRVNTGTLQVSGNLVTEKYIELLRPLNLY